MFLDALVMADATLGSVDAVGNFLDCSQPTRQHCLNFRIVGAVSQVILSCEGLSCTL